MKKTIIVLGTVALIGAGNSAMAEGPDTGHTTEVTPGDWDDDDPKLNFNFQDIPQSKYSGLKLTLTCGLPEAQILYTTDPKATPSDTEAWHVYTEPLYLTEDCTVRFFARCEGYNDSDIQAYTFVFADHQAIAPQIAPDMERTHLMMTCETSGASIRYTTDGSEPTAESALYEGPVELTENCVFRARSFADEMFDSEISEYTVDFLTAGLPGAAFENRALVLTPSGENENVYFTTDPDATTEDIEAWTLYTAPIALTEDCTVRYFGRRAGFNDSEIASFSFVFAAYQTAAPVLTSDAAGTHVVMECETEGAEIRYTTDGSEPTAQSALYTEPVEITGNGTFRARAFKDGLFDSNTVDFIVMHMAVPSPTAVFENKHLVLSCADAKAKIMYTLDADATPDNTGAWSLYEGPIALTENCTVRFYGVRDNFNDSDIQSFAFIYSNYRAADPTIERNAEGTHIVMESATEGAEIRYTTDGSEPTAQSTLYTGPVEIEGNFTFSAVAIADGLFDSQVNRYVVSNMAAPNPTASFENLLMSLACPDAKAQIWYTTDAEATTDDTSAWTLYSAPFEMTGDCTLRFFSRRANFNDSDIESLTFVYAAYQAPAPSIDRNAQGTHLIMASSIEGAEIRYTTDGSEPTSESTLYAAPVRITEGATYRAKVFAENMYVSEVSEYIIGNDKLSVPTAAYDNFTLVLSTADEGASIWYTTDPELSLDDIEAWTLYEGPIALGDDCTYRFFAGDDDANASDVQSFVFQKADWQVAVPTIERDEEGTHIVMETPTEGAEIRYTTDGSEPTAESTLYTEPVLIECNGTFRARAFVKGLYDSEVTDFVVANMACPVAYASFENKLLTLTCEDSKAEIWYTNDDDAVPEETENWQLYTGPVALTENCYIHFFTRRENFNDSDIETFVFLRANYMAATPLIDRSEDGRSIVMTTETEGAEIRYTTDGSEPTEESELYTEPVFIVQNCTFRAKAFADGLFESALSEYTVANLTMMMPYATFENLHLNLSVWDEAASVWYTLDPEATPEDTDAWTLYTEPIALTEDCTVRFFSRRGGFLDSQIASYEFVYADWQTAAPAITVNAEDKTITMKSETEAAEIHYTLDGTEPTAESAVYTGAIALPGNCVIKAVAMKDGLFDSVVSEETVSFLTVADPTAVFENLALTLSVEDEYAQILYTFDTDAAVETVDSWTIYTDPITFDDDCTVRYFARRSAYNDSEVMTFTLVYADWQTAAPELQQDADNNTVVITCPTEGAEIRYTTDGSEPTAESELYTGPIEAENGLTVRARAFANGLYDSEISELTVSGFSGVDTVLADGLKVCKEGGNVVVYSDKAISLPVYTLDGNIAKIINVIAGRNVIENLDSNIYIIGNVRIKL